MHEPAEILFLLLRLSTGGDVDFPLIGEEVWQQVYDLASHQALLGVVFRGIEALPDSKWPPRKLSMRFYSQVKFIKDRNESLCKLSRAVSDRMRSDGLGCVLLKGQGLASLYPDPCLRVGGDVDVWSDAPRGQLVSYARMRYPRARACYHHIDFGSSGKFGVELHFTPTWMNSPFGNRRLQNFFNATASEAFSNFIPMAGGSVAVPVPAFNRVFILVHIFRHLFSEGVGLRQLMDYYYVLAAGFTEEERIESVEVIKSVGLFRFAGAVMHVLGRVFGLGRDKMLVEPDAARGESLLSEVMRAGNFGVDDRSFTHNGAGKFLRTFRFAAQYPSEVFWAPFFKLWQLIFIRLRYNH